MNFGQEEGRNGAATSGQYHVLLPDGRTQTVTYNVGDAYTGYVADVKYSGNFFIKFSFSEKATKIWLIFFMILLSKCQNHKADCSNFLAFSEKLNFKMIHSEPRKYSWFMFLNEIFGMIFLVFL